MVDSSLFGVHAEAHVKAMEKDGRNPECCLWQLYHRPSLVYKVDSLCSS